jgi:hypothetical protein
MAGSFMGRNKLLVGGAMEDSSGNAAPFDARYLYLAGGVRLANQCVNSCDGSCGQWWGCWNSPMGQFAKYHIEGSAAATWQSASRPQIPLFTYYELLQSAQNYQPGFAEGNEEVNIVNDAVFLKLYLDDWRFLLQTIGTTQAMLHIEPDLWAFARNLNSNPQMIAAKVTTANPTDCGAQENSLSGLAACMISMTRKYAPNATVGLHASAWLIGNPNDGVDTGNFMVALNAGQGDFMVTDVSDRDAGYYQSIGQNNLYSDADHAKFLAWSKAVSTVVGKPMLIWQIPLGNMNQNNTNYHWKDNHVDYFFNHLADVARSKVAGLLFGAGADLQTTIETDGNNLINKTFANWQAGGQDICQ